MIGVAIFLGNKYLGQGTGQGSVKGVSSYAKDDPAAPKIEILENSFDFGKIQLSDVVKYPFKVKNVGKNPLTITSVTTSCHCTTVVVKIPGQDDSPSFGMHAMGVWQGEILPGQEAILDVTYEPAKHPAKGPIERIIYLQTNDPNNKDSKLEIKAEVL